MLEQLPLEILLAIAEWLCPRTIRSLCLVSSRLFASYRRIAYRTVVFRAESEWALNVLDVEKFFGRHARRNAAWHTHLIRNLQFTAPIHIARFSRCAYFNAFRICTNQGPKGVLGCSNEPRAHEQFLDDISRQVQLVLGSLRSDQLHSFRWCLGVCLPQGVLGKGGSLARQQNSLKSLTLVTDASCPHVGASLRGLGRLNALEALTWEGIQHRAELDALRACLYRNRSHLRS